jgi:hypothetical protein
MFESTYIHRQFQRPYLTVFNQLSSEISRMTYPREFGLTGTYHIAFDGVEKPTPSLGRDGAQRNNA